MTSARLVWMHWCVWSPARSVDISPYRLLSASWLLMRRVFDSFVPVPGAPLLPAEPFSSPVNPYSSPVPLDL
uniref:Putative secreted protein n=1 Tax=Anopheles triannulatus TaxID=58253 RepID=A0A2M4B7V5_9DIPT